MIDSDEEVEGQPELKCRKVDQVPVVEIWQPDSSLLSLFWDLVSLLQEHIVEQWKQTRFLVWLVCIQEFDCVEWARPEMVDLETGSEESGEMGTEAAWDEGQDGNPLEDKGKGKEKERQSRVEDGDKIRNGDGNGNKDGNGKAEML